jgi:RNA polymerase sigma-B factor
MIQARPCVEIWLRERLAENRDRVVEEYRYLCARAARRFVRPGMERADLEQTAVIGLIKAVDRYDAALTTPFEAFAWLLVLGELMHHVRDYERIVRAPRRVRDLERRWTCGERELRARLGREPSAGDVAAFINAAPPDVRDVQEYRASGHTVAIEDLQRVECQMAAASMDGLVERLAIENELHRLEPLERTVLTKIYIEGLAVGEVATQVGYSRRHVTRVRRNALRRMATFVRPQ